MIMKKFIFMFVMLFTFSICGKAVNRLSVDEIESAYVVGNHAVLNVSGGEKIEVPLVTAEKPKKEVNTKEDKMSTSAMAVIVFMIILGLTIILFWCVAIIGMLRV